MSQATDLLKQQVRSGESDRRVYDVPVPSWQGGGADNVMEIRGEIHGIGVTGLLHPGAMAYLLPASYRSKANDFSLGPYHSFSFGDGGMGNPGWVMGPGDVQVFDPPLKGGILIGALTAFCNFVQESSLTSDRVPYPRMWARIYREKGNIPTKLHWWPAPAVQDYTAYTEAVISGDDPSSDDDGVPIPVETTHVSLHFVDNVTTARIQGAETGQYEVWFFLASNLWALHPDDAIKAAGPRLTVNADHDVEVYHLPRNAHRIYLKKTAGDTLGAWVISTREER